MGPAGRPRRTSAVGGISLGQIVATTRRYQPVAIGVLILLIVFALLPEPDRVQSAAEDAATLLDSTRAAPPSVPNVAAEALPSASPGVGADAFSSSPTPSSPVAASFGDASTASGSSASPSDGPSSDDDLPTFSGPSVDSDSSDEGTPLRIIGSTWATRQAGTPLAADGVPAGTLPVGMRVTEDKLSFVRLAGDQSVLELVEDPAGARSTNGPALVQLCQVTDGSWKDGEAIAMDDAPAWDSAECTVGTRRDDGVWTFDMLSFDSPADPRGFAVVPAEGAGVDFQVAFKKSA